MQSEAPHFAFLCLAHGALATYDRQGMTPEPIANEPGKVLRPIAESIDLKECNQNR